MSPLRALSFLHVVSSVQLVLFITDKSRKSHSDPLTVYLDSARKRAVLTSNWAGGAVDPAKAKISSPSRDRIGDANLSGKEKC